jgi:hypothetical protein
MTYSADDIIAAARQSAEVHRGWKTQFDTLAADLREMHDQWSCSRCGREAIVITHDGQFCGSCQWARLIKSGCVAVNVGSYTNPDQRCRMPVQHLGETRLPLCDRHYSLLVMSVRDEVRKEAHAVALERAAELAGSADDAVVYFVAQGAYVKIGTTTNLTARLRALSSPGGGCRRPDDLPVGDVELLVTQSGGRAAEQLLHRRFGSLRVAGEWFRREPELDVYVEQIRSRGEGAAA